MYDESVMEKDTNKIHVYEWKKEHPAAILCLVHGIGEYAGRYDHIGEYLKGRNIGLIGFDLRGHGQSTGVKGHAAPRKKIFSDISDLILMAEDKYPGVPIYLYGHSMGGNIVLDYSRRGNFKEKIAGFIVTAPWLILSKKISALSIAIFRVISVLKPDFTINTGLKAKDISKVDAEVDKYIHDPLIHHKISALTAIDGIRASKALLSAAAGSGKRMLLMHGSQDRICSVEGSRDLARIEGTSCTYIEWDGLYHEIHNEKNGIQVLETMADWIVNKYYKFITQQVSD